MWDSLDQCAMQINADQNPKIPVNADQCRSMPDQGISKINIDRHWANNPGSTVYGGQESSLRPTLSLKITEFIMRYIYLQQCTVKSLFNEWRIWTGFYELDGHVNYKRSFLAVKGPTINHLVKTEGRFYKLQFISVDSRHFLLLPTLLETFKRVLKFSDPPRICYSSICCS